MKAQRWTIDRWTVDYGDGREPVHVPHAWRQDLDVRSEGPVTYRVKLHLPPEPAHLVFHGVSYAAEVRVNGEVRARHRGIWDSFTVAVDDLADQHVELEVEVVKNGGPTYSLGETAAGFLPFVHSSFGGIFREVELVLEAAPKGRPWKPSIRIQVEGRQILVDSKPFYPRGVLHWGWYPELGHPNPSEETIRREIGRIKQLGFNLIKLCLWVPPHRYLSLMREEGLEAWMELPIWMPTSVPEDQGQILAEVEAIVRQYRHHDNILAWSIGCELGEALSPEVRQELCQRVRNLTLSPLVGDSSGGAEMYGGDPREFGDFEDFHPYCDLPFFPPMLDSLLPGPRVVRPTLLGEFNDIDVHRDLARVHDEMPFWASSMAELNDRGARWQYDLPGLMTSCRFVHEVSANRSLIESSVAKAAFIRKTVQEAVRARGEIAGYVITGLRDTPISSSGMLDDWGASRFATGEVIEWNGGDCIFLIPSRRPPWVAGGNRAAMVDPVNVFAGLQMIRIGLHSEPGGRAGLSWQIRDSQGNTVASGASEIRDVPACVSTEIGAIEWFADEPGEYVLEAETGATKNSWPITVIAPFDLGTLKDFSLEDPRSLMADIRFFEGENRLVIGAPNLVSSGLAFLLDIGTTAVPFWREAAYEFVNPEFWATVPFAEKWSKLLPVSPDRVIDPDWLVEMVPDGSAVEVLMNRIDTRTYAEAPILVRVTLPDGGQWIITTLRPFGGLGNQPISLTANPAGCLLLTSLARALQIPTTTPVALVEVEA